MAKTIPVPERSFYARWGVWLILVLALLLPVVIWGAVRAAQSNNNNIKQWLPEDMPETAVYRRFKQHFGTDEFALVSWKGCKLSDERLEPFAAAVRRQRLKRHDYAKQGLVSDWVATIADWLGEETAGPADQSAGAPLFEDAISGPQLVEKLQQAELTVIGEDLDPQLTRDEIIERFQGLFIGREKVGVDAQGRDDYPTCVVVKLAAAGNNDRTAAVEALYEAAKSIGIPREDVYLGGETVSNAALDTESQRAINSLTGIAVLVAIAMALISLRSIRLTFVVFLVAGYSAVLAQALVHFTGGQLNLVLVVMPVLVLVLAMSAGVHVVNYYRDAVRVHGRQGAARRAVADGWLPCSLAAVTTAVGLLSLNVSHVVPVQKFGQYGALGIMASLVFVFLLLPSLLERRWIGGGVSARSSDSPALSSSIVRALAETTIRYRVAINVMCLVALVVFGIGATKINTSVKPMRFYKQDTTIVRDATWFETHLGPLVPMEVVIHFDNERNKMTFD
ncbi:MAG: MMPL family transporter [Planctomycetes bacterium]|nr:MMPL family transporter [Planctomycetota bacterium]